MDGKNENRATLLVFLKAPVAGEVKTRIGETIGHEDAADLYRSWIPRILLPLQSLRGQIRLVAFYAGDAAKMTDWIPLFDEWWPQPPGDLGARLTMGFRQAQSDTDKVIAIGTDCLEIDAETLTRALKELERVNAVLGPTHDGGYYLFGTAGFGAGLFQEIRWSTEHTAADQIKRCEALQWSVSLLEMKTDIDTWEDWKLFCQSHPPHEDGMHAD